MPPSRFAERFAAGAIPPISTDGVFAQDNNIFDKAGAEAFREGFVRENVFLGAIDWFKGNTTSDRIDQLLVTHRAYQDHDDDVNFSSDNLDSRLNSAPSHYAPFVYRARNAAEGHLILDALEAEELEHHKKVSAAQGSYALGAMSGALTSYAGFKAFQARRFKDLIGVAVAHGIDEAVLHQVQGTRTLEQSIMNTTLGTAGTGAFVGVYKVFKGMSNNIKGRQIEAYIDSIDDNIKAARVGKDVPDENIRANKHVPDDELPFETTPSARTKTTTEDDLKINPEDEADDFFDPLKHGSTADTGRWQFPVIGKVIGERLVKAFGLEKLPDNPVKRILMGESDIARGLVGHLVEHPFWTNKNLGGLANAIGVDRIMAQNWLGQRMVPAMRKTEEFYRTYRNRISGDARKTFFQQKVMDRIRPPEEEVLAVDDFLREVSKAKRRLGDPGQHHNFAPEVIMAARYWDDVIYKPLAQEAKRLRMFSIRERREIVHVQKELKILELKKQRMKEGLIKEEDPVLLNREIEELLKRRTELEKLILKADELEITPTFVNRLYNHTALQENAAGFRQLLVKHGYSVKEAERLRLKILREVEFSSTADPVGLARSLKLRTIENVPDTALEEFLENNIIALGRYYAIRMGTDVELFKKFGSLDLKPHIRTITKEFNRKIDAAKTVAEKEKLTKARDQAVEDIETIRDRVRGTYGIPENPDSWTNRGIRVARMWNATSMLTGALAAVPDIGNVILHEGFARTFRGAFEVLFQDMRLLKLGHQEANLAGEGLDMWLAMRAAMFADLGESISVRNKFERAFGAGTQAFFNINLMNQWNAAAKTLAGIMAGSRFIDDSILSTAHLRNSGAATVKWGDPRGYKGQPIPAKYNRRLNRVEINKKALEEGFKNKAWRNPRLEGVKPLSDKVIQNLNDWKRFVVEHELVHADFAKKAGETLVAYENRVNRIALRRMTTASKKVRKHDVNRLRRVGISEDTARRIADQAETYGIWGEHVRIARTHLWDDQEAAQIYRSALGKDINTIIVTPGKGDLPNVVGGGLKHLIPESAQKAIRGTYENLPEGRFKDIAGEVGSVFMSEEMSRLIFQFKSFAIAAQHRVLTPGLQQFDQNILIGAVALVGLGAVVDTVRRKQLGTHYGGSFDQRLMRAIERSGIGGYGTDLLRVFENIQNPISQPGRAIGAVGGPIVQQIENVSDVLFDYGRFNVGTRTNKSLIDTMPLSNVAHLKWLSDFSHHAVNTATGVD
jgi:hypothetical protein